MAKANYSASELSDASQMVLLASCMLLAPSVDTALGHETLFCTSDRIFSSHFTGASAHWKSLKLNKLVESNELTDFILCDC